MQAESGEINTRKNQQPKQIFFKKSSQQTVLVHFAEDFKEDSSNAHSTGVEKDGFLRPAYPFYDTLEIEAEETVEKEYSLLKKSIAFKIPNALTGEINKDQESILNTYNEFYYKRKNGNAAVTDTVNRSRLGVYCTLYIFNLNAYSSRDSSVISIHLLQSIMEDAELFPINKPITCLGCHLLTYFPCTLT